MTFVVRRAASTRMDESLKVEVVYATAEYQRLAALRVTPGTTVAQALAKSGLGDRVEGSNMPEVGIFGRLCPLESLVKEGDRIEIYRPLNFDPMESRRRRAAKAGRIKR